MKLVNKKWFLVLGMIAVMLAAAVSAGCGGGAGPAGEAEGDKAAVETGTLQFRANGEDFIRQGFVSKDGWRITFDHVYVTLAEVTAYQADPPYDAEQGGEVQAGVSAVLPGTYTVDLAEGDENAPPILVGEVKDVPSGYYNALSWKMVRAASGEAEGYSIVFTGKAVKDGQTISFTLKDERQYAYTGGEYIGDERKGIVSAGGTGELEMTFHADHIFGDAGTPADDGLNVGALGFAPLAAIAVDGVVDADLSVLKDKLSPADYENLVNNILLSLGHVGEGHCHCEVL